MGSAKDIILRPIPAAEANALVRHVHYSGKTAPNSQFHIGVYYRGKLEGAMQFGPPMSKHRTRVLVEGTQWNEFLELNRMAFSDVLPRNSESRALSIALRILRKHAPHVKWVVSFADATLCGDGTIYRAAGFVLTGIGRNTSLYRAPDGSTLAKMTASAHNSHKLVQDGEGNAVQPTGAASTKVFRKAGYQLLPGYQLRYVYFLDPTYRARLTVPELPYSAIDERGARMYRGEKPADQAPEA